MQPILLECKKMCHCVLMVKCYVQPEQLQAVSRTSSPGLTQEDKSTQMSVLILPFTVSMICLPLNRE